MVKGQTLSLRGEEFTIAPLTAADLEDMEVQVQRILKLNDYPTKEDWRALGDLLFASLQVNHPSIERARVQRLIDTENWRDVIRALLFAAMALTPGKDPKPGEPARP